MHFLHYQRWIFRYNNITKVQSTPSILASLIPVLECPGTSWSEPPPPIGTLSQVAKSEFVFNSFDTIAI